MRSSTPARSGIYDLQGLVAAPRLGQDGAVPDLAFITPSPLRPAASAPAALAIRNGLICAPAPDLPHVDCRGFAVLPGLVDLHGDGFERHLAPRRGAVSDLREALRAVDAELAANGITTAVLAQFWSWEGGMRGPDFARALAAALHETARMLNTRMILQLRLETHMEPDLAEAEAFIAEAGIGYVVLNDHLPHDALAAGRRPPRLTGQALKAGRSPETHLEMLQRLHARGPDVDAALPGLCARLAKAGVRLGSHDDPTPQQRAAFRNMDVAIAEFPQTEATAQASHAAGDAVILGAPNVVRGGSHTGKLRAQDMVQAGLCDALVSDYHYPSLRLAALQMVEAGLSPEAAWDLVSARPAALLGLTDRGTLKQGARADITVIDVETGQVAATFVGGRVSHLAGAFADRLLSAT